MAFHFPVPTSNYFAILLHIYFHHFHLVVSCPRVCVLIIPRKDIGDILIVLRVRSEHSHLAEFPWACLGKWHFLILFSHYEEHTSPVPLILRVGSLSHGVISGGVKETNDRAFKKKVKQNLKWVKERGRRSFQFITDYLFSI